MNDAIETFMTRSVHTIGTKAPLAEAHRMMNDHGIRHLPVLEGGRLVGLLSQRDLHLIETLRDVDPKEVLVEEAMTQDAYTVAPETPLGGVAREMARHKYGSAVIVRGSVIVRDPGTESARGHPAACHAADPHAGGKWFSAGIALADHERSRGRTRVDRGGGWNYLPDQRQLPAGSRGGQ